MNAPIFHISPYDLAFLATIFVGLTFTLLLWFTKNTNRAANRWLAGALAVVILRMVWLLGVDIRPGAYFPFWSWLPLPFSLAPGPLVYFYVLKITRPEYKFRRRDLLHFSPLLLELGAWAMQAKYSIRAGAAAYQTPLFHQLNPAVQLLAFISVSAYLYASEGLIAGFYRGLKFNEGDRYRYKWRWLHHLLMAFGLLWLLWIPFTYADYFYYQHQLGIHAYYPLYLLLAIMMIWTAAVAFSRPVVTASAGTPSFLKPLLPLELKQKGTWLKKMVKTNLYYQDPELSLVSLAEKLELTTHELSRIINMVLKKSFNDFVNEFRVAEAIRKMQDPAYDQLTLMGIAYDSGFNSKSAFHRIFREKTGKSPAEYKAGLKKELPSYNLGQHPQLARIISYQQTIPRWPDEKSNRNYMFKNYLKTAWRTLWKQKAFSAINVLGLTFGISASLVIYLVVSYDLSFDKFERDNGRIYRVVSAFVFSGEKAYNSGVAAPTAAAIGTELTGLDAVVPFFTFDNNPNVSIPMPHQAQPAVFKNQGGFVYADKNYFDLIGYHWLAGSAKTSLQQAYQTVLTQSAADLYFPNLPPGQIVGKRFYLNDTVAVTVSGVVENIEANTDFTFKVFVSKPTFETARFRPPYYAQWSGTSSASQLFVKLKEGTSPEKIQKQMTALYFRHWPKKPGDNYQFNYVLQPLSDLHFNANYGNYSMLLASFPVLWGLLAVAAFLLLLGCINFINLTTAQASRRAKEIGIRKTMGGSKKQLITQFLSESFLLTFMATALSAGLTPVILNAFSGFVPQAVKFNVLQQPGILLFLLVLVICVTLLSGIYPALVLSSYKPVAVLKNQITAGSSTTRNTRLRRILTVSQFAIAQFFIMATILVGKQVSYSLHKDMGFKKDAIVYFGLNNPDTSKSRQTALLNRLGSIPEIASVSLSNNPPSSGGAQMGEMSYKDGKKEITTTVVIRDADTNYIKLYGIKLLAGNNLSPLNTNPASGILINETYLHVLGFQNPQEAIGKILAWNDKPVPVRGVIKDFNQKSLHEPIKPLVIASEPANLGLVNLLLQPKNADGSTWETALAKTKKAFKDTYPDNDVWYGFFDQDIAKYYQQEQNTSRLLNWATMLSILISCLGLLGLVIFTTAQRTKEIGVRKVLGASVTQIITLISKDFLRLVVIAFIIAVPLAWIGMNQWLQNFAFRTAISWWIFAAAALLMLVVAFITLSFQAVRAALTNPVKSLRTE